MHWDVYIELCSICLKPTVSRKAGEDEKIIYTACSDYSYHTLKHLCLCSFELYEK